MPEKEFVENYVRTMTPVLIHGCDFNWLNTNDHSLSGAAKVIVNHYNGTGNILFSLMSVILNTSHHPTSSMYTRSKLSFSRYEYINTRKD